jgi:drug/metabolite transporter (DMT)-like permease
LSAKNWFKFIALGLIWGSSFFWIKIGLQEVGNFTVVFFRVLFAAVGLVLFFLLTRKRLPARFWWIYLVLGIFNVALPFMLVTWSEKSITSGMASVLNSTQPLATMLIAAIFIKEEKLTSRRIIGLVLGISGVFLLMSDRLYNGSGNQAIGIVAMILAVLCYGSSAVFARMNNSGVRPEDQSLGQMLFGLVVITPVMLNFESPVIIPVRPISYMAFAWLGLLGSFFAGITWYGLINEIGPSRASTVMYMAPVVGVILGAIALHEKVDWRLIAGGALILTAIIIVNTVKKSNGNIIPIENEQYEG